MDSRSEVQDRIPGEPPPGFERVAEAAERVTTWEAIEVARDGRGFVERTGVTTLRRSWRATSALSVFRHS